jgi:hypothetical protein
VYLECFVEVEEVAGVNTLVLLGGMMKEMRDEGKADVELDLTVSGLVAEMFDGVSGLTCGMSPRWFWVNPKKISRIYARSREFKASAVWGSLSGIEANRLIRSSVLRSKGVFKIMNNQNSSESLEKGLNIPSNRH